MFGNVPRDIWSYDPNAWPPDVPEGVDKKASLYRIHHYSRARDEMEIKCAIANGHPVAISVPYFAQWCSTENGLIEFPGQNEASIGMHSVSVVGYRDDDRYFHFVNSWGANWGDNGCGWLPYGYFEQHGFEAIVFSHPTTEYALHRYYQQQHGISITEWGLPNPARPLLHGVSMFDHDQNEEAAWAFAFEENESLDVEEFFVSPRYRKRGFARDLLKSMSQLAIKVGKPFKYWLPIIDNVLLGQDVHDLAWNFNLRIEESPVKWAAKVLLHRTSQPRV